MKKYKYKLNKMCTQNTRDFPIIRIEDQDFARNNSALIDTTDIFNDQDFENIEVPFEEELDIDRFLRRQIENHIEYLILMDTFQTFSNIQNRIQRIQTIQSLQRIQNIQ